MGSSLSPVIANLYMEHFEEVALSSFHLKPKWWKHYVDDMNVCWPHGLETLEAFHAHLNNLVHCISFTKELEVGNQLSFLDILLIKQSDGSLGHKFYHK